MYSGRLILSSVFFYTERRPSNGPEGLVLDR